VNNLESKGVDFKEWWNLPTRFGDEQLALNLLLSADREAACAAAFTAGRAEERERCATWLELADGNRDQREHAAKLAAMLRRA
jgi:hypothetical protein